MRFQVAFQVIAATLGSTSAQTFRGYSDRPTSSPTSSPTVCDISCNSDEDCPRICDKPYNSDRPGKCISASPPTPTEPGKPTHRPTAPPTECPCEDILNIPDKCEVMILVDLMDDAVKVEPKLLAQWTRAAFHDAGTFDQNSLVGGANGCLMNDPDMREQDENLGLDEPLDALEVIKNTWEADPNTCIKISSADIIQFAAFFATTRQKNPAGTLTSAKKVELIDNFHWGRLDADDCDITWTHNLPSFKQSQSKPIPTRCAEAGNEIESKMINLNGFTAQEANVLIGAHTIGMIRFEFSSAWFDPWVKNGVDNATPNGPVFDNAYHHFLIHSITANDVPAFDSDQDPFDHIFDDWFGSDSHGVSHLDTDVALAFPPAIGAGATHPDYRPITELYANDNIHFLEHFFLALDKMSRLGVFVSLVPPTECEERCRGEEGRDPFDTPPRTVDGVLSFVENLGTALTNAKNNIRIIQKGRREEIIKATTPIKQVDAGEEVTKEEPPRV